MGEGLVFPTFLESFAPSADKKTVEENGSMILILEDDETLGTALKETLSRAGHQVFLSSRPDEAAGIISGNRIEFVFCDCLLPQMTGIDFILKTRESFPDAKFKTILMSGIYTDKAFIKEAIAKTQALAFLSKPFGMEEVLKFLKKEEKPKKEEANSRKLLYQMFSNPNVTNRQKRKMIESVEEVSGFDLPFIYSLLVETKSSGYLNIYHSNGVVSGITFCHGNIVGVDVEDKTTYLGEMLIQSGFALPEDVQAALRDKNNRRIGNQLLHANQLSPHAFDFMLAEQMNIRLSRTITDEKIRINFAATDVEMVSPYVDSEALLGFLHDWIASKVSLNWLKSLYMMWAGYVIVPAPSYNPEHPAFRMMMFKALENFNQNLDKKLTIHQLLAIPGYNERAVYKGIHFLLTRGQIIFEQKTSFTSEAEQLEALKKIYNDTKELNDFAMLEYMESCVLASGDTRATSNEFVGFLGTAPNDQESEAYQIWTRIKNKAETSANNASDSKQRAEFKEATARTGAEAKLKASHLMDDAKQALQMNQYVKAATILAQVLDLNPQIQYFHLYNSWAKLGTLNPAKKQFQLKEIELELVQVPPDERYDAIFPLVLGLFGKAKGDIAGARKSFERSIGMDPTLIVARRELSLLESQNKKQDILKMDLKEMVSGFFKKKS